MKKVITVGVLAALCLLAAYGWRVKRANDWSRRLLSTDPAVVEAARAELLAGGKDHVETLRALLAEQAATDWEAEELVLKVLEVVRELGPAAVAAAPELVALTTKGESLAGELAAQTLPAVGVPAAEAVPALAAQILRAPNVSALRALAEYRTDAASTAELLSQIMIRMELPTDVRWNAARTLGKARAVAAMNALVERLQDSEPTVREHAAEALGDIGPPAAAAATSLIGVLGDEYVKVRRDAVRSLGQIDADPQVVIPAIQPLLKDPETIVRDAAKQALERLQAAPPAETVPAAPAE